MRIVKAFIDKNPIDALIEKCFYESVDFEVLGNSESALKSIAKPRIRKRKTKKWKVITIYVVKKLKNGQKVIKPKNVKIPANIRIPQFKRKKPRGFVPKSLRAILKPYFT